MTPEIDLLAEARPATPAPADVVPPAERALLLHRIVTTPDPRRAPRRRPAVLRLAAPAAAVGAAAVLAVTVVARPATPPPAPPADTGSVGYVVARAETALAAAGGMVLVSTVGGFRRCASRTLSLLDADGRPARLRWTETCGGRPSQDTGQQLDPARPDALLTTTVHHTDRTWSRAYVPAGSDPQEAFPQVGTPESFRADLAAGQLVVVGREQVDGRATVHLRAPSTRWPRALDPQYWVDASSYLLVRSRIVKGSAEDRTLLVTDHEWLRPTPDLRAQLTVPVPAGYRRTG